MRHAMATTRDVRSPRSRTLAALGLAAVICGVVLYFVALFALGGRLPGVRNHAVPSWILVGGGLALSALAVRQAARGRRLLADLLAGTSGVLALAFAGFLYAVLAVPEASGPAIGSTAPDFALSDQHGRTVRLADFRGRPLLLVFYRGHW